MSSRFKNIKSRFDPMRHGGRLRLDPELDSFCSAKIDRMLRFFGVASLPLAFVFQIIGLVLEQKVSIFSGVGEHLLIFHGISFTLLGIALCMFWWDRPLPGRGVVLSYFYLTAYLVTRVCDIALSMSTYNSLQIYFYGTHNIVLALMIIAVPFKQRSYHAVFALFCGVLNVWMVAGKDAFNFHVGIGAVLMLLIYGGAFVVRMIVDLIFMNFFIGEYDALQRVVKAERALFDRDLDLARQIQDALVPAPKIVWNNASIQYYSKKHRVVGGDWASIHGNNSDKLTIVMADAMGKGIHAAMLIHTVQSLWADVIGRDGGIDPESWLRRVNHALYNLDRERGNFVTIGLLQLMEDEGVYWSAGHLPLYLADLLDDRAGKSLISHGEPCGLSSQFSVEPKSFSLTQHNVILLGTDGVFGKGSRHTRRQIHDIARQSSISANALGTLDLDALSPIDDDKTLITVFFQSTSAQKVAEAL
jgi:hypothetical protein